MNLKLDNVGYKYSLSQNMALTAINYEMKGNKIGLIGSSGSGKSTLIHLLNALFRPTDGSIQIGTYTIDNKSKLKQLQDVRKRVAIVYQFTDLQLFSETVEKELKFAVNNFGIEKADIDLEIENHFKRFNLDLKILKKSPFSLSGGQKKKVSIITMLLIEPEILILDEPTVGLDPQSLRDILAAIDELTAKGLKVIMISHDMNAVYTFCDNIIELAAGEKTFDGSKHDYFKQQYYEKNLLLLPTELAYAASIDEHNSLFEQLYSGAKLEDFIKEKNV